VAAAHVALRRRGFSLGDSHAAPLKSRNEKSDDLAPNQGAAGSSRPGVPIANAGVSAREEAGGSAVEGRMSTLNPLRTLASPDKLESCAFFLHAFRYSSPSGAAPSSHSQVGSIGARMELTQQEFTTGSPTGKARPSLGRVQVRLRSSWLAVHGKRPISR
jgi:hypothetical protein